MTTTAQAYRSASLQHASHLDLLLAAYDALAQDLRLAGLAAETGSIAERCSRSNHALLLVGHLESWTAFLGDTALEANLAQFYTFVRNEVMKNQDTRAGDAFASLALRVCEVRAAWQQKGTEAKPAGGVSTGPLTDDYASGQTSGGSLSFSA